MYVKPEEHKSIGTEIKPGEHKSIKTEFKPSQIADDIEARVSIVHVIEHDAVFGAKWASLSTDKASQGLQHDYSGTLQCYFCGTGI